MITVQADVDSDQAARRLVDHAIAAGRTIHDVACEVVERRLRFDGK
jgi:hypothetical protein